MKKRHLYVCYQIVGDFAPVVMFYTINKKLFDFYVDLFKDVLTPDRYEFRVLGIEQYAQFRKEHPQSELDVFEPGNNTGFSNKTPMVTTSDDINILNPADLMHEWLGLSERLDLLLDRLPYRLRVPLMRTKYWQLVHDDGSTPAWQEDMFGVLTVDYDKLHYIALYIYYGMKGLEYTNILQERPPWYLPPAQL